MLLHSFAKSFGSVCIVLALTACGQSSEPVGQPMPIDGKTVAKVNGVEIKEPEVQALIEARSSGGQAPGREEAINELIDMELLRQQAVADGLHNDPEIRLQINRNATNALISGFVRQLVDSQPITDEQLKAEYEKRFGALPAASKEYKSSHILVETEETAQGVVQSLEGGADFAELATEKSTGPSAQQGGDLGWSSPDNYVPEFADALKSLEPGEFTHDPVKTRFGWHVIKLDETREGGTPDIDRYKPQLQRMIVNQRLQDYVAGLKDKATINMLDEATEDAGQGSEQDSAADDESAGAETDSGENEASTDGDENDEQAAAAEDADPALKSK